MVVFLSYVFFFVEFAPEHRLKSLNLFIVITSPLLLNIIDFVDKKGQARSDLLPLKRMT